MRFINRGSALRRWELVNHHRFESLPDNRLGIAHHLTVPRGTERLRITPTPFHNDRLIDRLAKTLREVWDNLGLRCETDLVPISRVPSLRSAA